MIIDIQEYRGFDICFNTDSEDFIVRGIYDDWQKHKSSFSACKSFIDSYRRENQNFEPFEIERIKSYGNSGQDKKKIIGIRKDNRFVYEDEKGNKAQLSEYDEKDYCVLNPENQIIWDSLKIIEIKRKEIYSEEENLRAKLSGKMLSDYKKEILQ